MSDLTVKMAGVVFQNPLIAASGTFGYGSEYSKIIPVQKIGGVCSKGLTLEPRDGNSGIRLWETPSGLMNSVGLENPGVKHFVRFELRRMKKLCPVVIANLSGGDLKSYVSGAKLLNKSAVDMIELNISCPNVKAGGMAWGLEAASAAEVVSAVRAALTNKPLVVKLSPNAPHLVKVAEAAVAAGADALSLVNTLQAFAVDIERARPVFANGTAGLSGPAIKPVALRLVRDVVTSVPECAPGGRVPVIGLGGISCWRDAVEFIMAGASAVQIGTAVFSNPFVFEEIIKGLTEFMDKKGYASIREMCGAAL